MGGLLGWGGRVCQNKFGIIAKFRRPDLVI